MKSKLYFALTAATLLVASARAQDLSGLPVYEPSQQVSGTIRSWGHGFLKPMMKLWEDGFKKYQPNIQFEDTLVSSAAAMAGLYSGRADIGVLAREITPPELAAYEKMMKQKIFPVTVLTGSYGNADKIMALGIFVHKDNPLTQLTFTQLDAIWGSEKRRGEKEVIRTWDQLGLTGEWKGKLIQPYSGLPYEAPGYLFSQTVLKGSVLWNCNLHEFEDTPGPGGDCYQKVVEALGKDPNGIALSGAGYRNPNIKLIALAVKDGGPFIEPTKQNVINLTYPLSRPVRFYINNGSASPADPKVIEFFRYILSREGQELVAKEGDFLPITTDVAHTEAGRLPH